MIWNQTVTTKVLFKNFTDQWLVIAKNIGDNLVNQIIDADKSGKTEIEIMVPEFLGATNDNWPLALYGAQRLPNALFTHKIIKNKLNVKFIPDRRINKKYKIN